MEGKDCTPLLLCYRYWCLCTYRTNYQEIPLWYRQN